MRLITVVILSVFTIAVFAPMKPAHATLTTGVLLNIFDTPTDTDEQIEQWIFDTYGETLNVWELDKLEAPATDNTNGMTEPGLMIDNLLMDGGEVYAGDWWYNPADGETVGFLVVKANGFWGLFDYRGSDMPNHGYFDVACLFIVNNPSTLCDNGLRDDLFGDDTLARDHAMSHITAYTPLPGAIWLFLSALAGMFGIGYTRRGRAT